MVPGIHRGNRPAPRSGCAATRSRYDRGMDHERTPDQSIEDVLQRVEAAFEAREGLVHAFVEEPGRFERLRREARDLERRFPEDSVRPPLFGLAVGVKDIINVEGLPTRAGTSLPPELFAGPEAPCVRRLREAGALVVGKTVTTEFAYLAPGPTRNPHDPDHTPGGSSSGSAAGVAAGLCDAALGTQTVGSLMRPAAFCGVHAMKPSKGRVPDAGTVALAPTLDHVGCLGRDLGVVEAVVATMVGDWAPGEVDDRPRIGVPGEDYLAHAEDSGRTHFGMVLSLLESMGFEVVRTDLLSGFDALLERHLDLMAVEAEVVHRSWRAEHERRYHAITRTLLDRAGEVDERRLAEAREHPGRLRGDLDAAMDERGIDLWIAPGAPGPAPLGLDSTGNGALNAPWTAAGVPTVSLPAGRNADGLPMGVQLSGRFGGDEALLARARMIDRVLEAD